MLRRHLEQPRRQFLAGALAKRRALVGVECRWRQPRPLSRDPLGVPLHEGIGLTLRSAARDRDANAAVVFDAKQIASRAAVANEVD
jgi:hypothetical protein